jgi:MFS family permease
MFLVGLVGFVAASALCGLATSPGTLIGFRIAQGLLGAMLIPQGFGILKATFPPDDLGKAFGAFGPTIGLAVVGAPILGGALIAWDVAGLGWRTIFLINVPLGLAALALAAAVLPSRAPRTGRAPTRSGWCWCRPASRCWSSRWWRAASWAGPRGRSACWPRGRAARRVRRAPGAARPGGPGTAGRARAVPGCARSPRAWRWGWRCSRA